MAEPLVTRAALEARLSPTTLGRVLDDSGQGTADGDAIDRCIADASSKVRGKLGPSITLSELDPAIATEAERITLDICHAYLAIRHPEVMRQDGTKLMQLAEKDLKEIRLGQADLGTDEPPKLQQGARVMSSRSRGWSEDCE